VSTDLTPGSVLGRYELLIQVAQGAVAQVWAARLRGSEGTQKTVAIKTITTNKETRAMTQALLLDEVRLAALVHHPNVVGTLELGEERGTLFIVMEWVHGETLRAVVGASYQYGGLPRGLAVNIVAQVCRALHAAHQTRDPDGKSTSLIHRDVSPRNLLIGYNGTVKVVDFGIAKAHQWNAEFSGRNDMKRKLAYMSPEQLMANGLDCRSDVFSAGVVLYLVTTGKHPFKASTPEETVQNVCLERPLRPSEIVGDYPLTLEGVVLKALSKDPRDRWSTAGELLEALLQAEPVTSDRHAEQRIAQFMNDMLGDTGRNRMHLVHHAQHWVDTRVAARTGRKIPPPLPRRSRRESTITLSNVLLPSIPQLTEPPSSREVVARAEPPRRLHSTSASDSAPSYQYRGSTPRSARDVSEAVPFTPVPIDSSPRSDWGALVPARRDKAPQALAWLGGLTMIALVLLLAIRETRKHSTARASEAPANTTLVPAEALPLECVGETQFEPTPVLVTTEDLPEADAVIHLDVKPLAPPQPQTPPQQGVRVAVEAASKKAVAPRNNAVVIEPRPPVAPRQVDAWDSQYYGGRN
jgi:eukaryotic-like serine/threonine-protein kinase